MEDRKTDAPDAGASLRSADGDRYRAECSRRYMEHVGALGSAVRRLQAEIDDVRAMLLPGGLSYGAPASPNVRTDAIPDGVARLHGLVADYCAELAGYVDEVRGAHAALARLSDERARSVLTLHYLHGMTWAQVAAGLSYSRQHVKALARAALADLYDFLPPAWAPPVQRAI